MLREIFCSGPVGNGMVTLHGDAGGPGERKMDLSLNLDNVPVNAVAQLARRAKKDLPTDLLATGTVQGNFGVKEDWVSARGPEFYGRGEIKQSSLAIHEHERGIGRGQRTVWAELGWRRVRKFVGRQNFAAVACRDFAGKQ